MFYSATDVKKGKIGSKPMAPTEGTDLRDLFDRFHIDGLVSAPSEKVEYRKFAGKVLQLRERYELDIRNLGKGRYVLGTVENIDKIIGELLTIH